MSDLTERLRSKRSCTVCEGDGIKSNGKECGGCKGSGEVYRHDRTGPEAADEIDRLTRELAEATKDRDYWKVEAEGERAKVAFRDKMTGDPDAIADRVVNAIHAEFNINLIGKADNQRLRSAVARALKEKP